MIPDDVTDIFADVAKHHIVLKTKALILHVTVDATLQEILSDVDKPTTYKRLRDKRGQFSDWNRVTIVTFYIALIYGSIAIGLIGFAENWY